MKNYLVHPLVNNLDSLSNGNTNLNSKDVDRVNTNSGIITVQSQHTPASSSLICCTDVKLKRLLIAHETSYIPSKTTPKAKKSLNFQDL